MINPTPDVSALLPCPFCGNLPEVYPQRTNSNALGDYYAVWCREPCQATGPERHTEAEAIAAWNQRATPEPAGDLVERVADAWQELIEYDDRTSPEEYPEMALITREELAAFMARTASPDLAAMPDRAAELERLKDENKNLSHHAVSGVLGDLLDLAEREALLDFIKHQRGLPDTRDEHISTLRTQLAASQADVARLREALKQMAVYKYSASQMEYIARAALKDTQP